MLRHRPLSLSQCSGLTPQAERENAGYHDFFFLFVFSQTCFLAAHLPLRAGALLPTIFENDILRILLLRTVPGSSRPTTLSNDSF